MSKSIAAPRVIRRIAARRQFELPNGKPVVLTIGVPQPVRASHWVCAMQITGLKTRWRRPRYVPGVDGLQALDLAIRVAAADLESTKPKLAWLGQYGDVGMPKYLPDVSQPDLGRLEAMVQREAEKIWDRAVRADRAKIAKTQRLRR